MSVVLRVTRHPVDSDREAALKAVFGPDLTIVTEDVPYGNDPVAAVANAIASLGSNVVAVEAIGPFPVLQRLVEAKRWRLIRATFQRDENGRAIVSGRDRNGHDILAFAGYEELVRISIETRPLLPE